ncbi:ribonuclease H-like domain-containing protein [Clostridium sp. AM58-1XD]|uniref:ribonuclease H-like domain-containing protein n=1 Tax=Clostridium sp. AM58-1XD TaxID=2292307 RepID=UPI000E545CF3|nr:ribonuclease H-like domain-containing protein [Clostridium sp. AM58-1XD]RGY97810.1 exonuclease [Clostridium sp. AM58-1XD]
MITVEKILDLPDTYPLERIGRLKDLLFFDIETTGFSGLSSNLYLIGCTYFSCGQWHLIQWFADTKEAEPDLLHAFFRFLKNFRTVVHFNGDGFDIPYLTKRCEALSLPYGFSDVESFDIYKKIRPYRRLLGLDSLKQKAIEGFLGISRTDQYNGGQLIEVYKDYLMTHEDFLYRLLMLHNEDDLKGMPVILPILNYPDFLEHPFDLRSCNSTECCDIFGRKEASIVLTCESTYDIPIPFSREDDRFPGLNLEGDGRMLTITIPMYTGALRHFFSEYKDYYYLIFEDTAVHKSVGEYVDKSARRQATASTCYTKREGSFLPQFDRIFTPELRREKKDKISYFEFNDQLFHNADDLNRYIGHLISHFQSCR